MSQNQAISAAFANSITATLVVTNAKAPTIIAANNALCTLVGHAQEELLNTELFESSSRLLGAMGLKHLQLMQLVEQVVATKVAVKGDLVKDSNSTENDFQAPVNGHYEIFPIIDESVVTCLVIQFSMLGVAVMSDSPFDGNPPVSKSSMNQSMEMLIDSLSNVIFTLDVESPGIYKFSFANRAFEGTTGLPVAEVIGKYVHEVIPEPSLTMVLEKYKEAIEGRKHVTWQEVSHYPAGQKIGEVMVAPVLNAKGECFRLAGLVHDITPFKEAEAKQVRLTQDLYQQNRDLQQFTYIISHNLRAPLANALGLVRHLPAITPGTETFDKCMLHLTESLEKLDKILLDLNMVLSVRDRQDDANLEPVSLKEVCKQAGCALEAELLQAGGQLQMEIDPAFRVQANRAYIYSICYNLLSNAIKYRSKERPLRIRVATECKGEEGPAVHFSDNGLGFDIHKAGPHLFKLYKRFHRHVEGRGVGLFLVKTHLEALGGHIQVESKVDEGTTFRVYFKELVK